VVFTGKQTHAVHYTVSRNFGFGRMGGVHSPAYHAGGPGTAEVFGDSAVTGDAAFGDEADDLKYAVEEIVGHVILNLLLPPAGQHFGNVHDFEVDLFFFDVAFHVHQAGGVG
jgi:hypothetical protein